MKIPTEQSGKIYESFEFPLSRFHLVSVLDLLDSFVYDLKIVSSCILNITEYSRSDEIRNTQVAFQSTFSHSLYVVAILFYC